MARALTLHFQGLAHWVVEFIIRALRNGGEMYVVLINPPEQDPWHGMRVRTMARTHPDDDKQTKNWIREGAAGAEKYFHHWLPFYLARPWVYAWLSPNEPQPMAELEFVQLLNAFLLRWAGLMHEHGLRAAGPQLGVGWPFLGFEGEPEGRGSDVRRLGPAFAAMDIWTFHEYGWPRMMDNAGFHCLRYRETVRQLLALGVQEKPVIVTECGLDGILEDGQPHSWRSQGISFEQYLVQLDWYNGELQKDRVRGAAVYTAVPSWPWGDYKIGQAEAWRLADYIAEDPPTWDWEPGPLPEPEPDPLRVADISGMLETHPTDAFPKRDIGDISHTVIHHSGGRQDPRYPRGHVKAIARYHVRAKKWPGIAYHYTIRADGLVYQCQPLTYATYHSGNWDMNMASVAICVLGDFRTGHDVPTPEQEASACALVRQLGYPVLAHKQIVDTSCPGNGWWRGVQGYGG